MINVFGLLLVCVYVAADTTIYGRLFGPGVCSIHSKDLKQVPILSMSIVYDTTYTLCWHFPPWCQVPTDRELYTFDTSLTNIQHEKLLLKCCSGYKLAANKRQCIPVCSVFCKQDSCIRPNNCTQCSEGYFGPSCRKDGPQENVTTTAPTHRCICPNENFMCDEEFKCVCVDGFQGPQCDELIPAALISNDGKKKSCFYYILEVSGIIGVLIAVGVTVIVIIKRRSSDFTPLNDSIG